MTVYYVDNAGSNTAPYDTWAKAATTLAVISAIDAAGDTIYVASTHTESTAGATTHTWAGTAAAPTRVICATTGAEPPTTLATGGAIATSGANQLATTGPNQGYIYYQGLTLTAGSGASGTNLVFGSGTTFGSTYDNCAFVLGTTGGAQAFYFFTDDVLTVLRNCTFKFAATTQSFFITGGHRLHVIGGSIDGAGSAITSLFTLLGSYEEILFEGFDFSAGATALNLCTVAGSGGRGRVIYRRCKLPASWSGSICSTTPAARYEHRLENSDSTDTNYRLWIKTHQGDITSETSVIKTSPAGASDGTTPISWKMVSTANTVFPFKALETDPIYRWNETVGSAITVTVEFNASSLLQNDDIALRIDYLGTSGFPLGSVLTTAAGQTSTFKFGDILNAGTNVSTSTDTWASGTAYKLSASITPQEKGTIRVSVMLYKASTTVYVNPQIGIS